MPMSILAGWMLLISGCGKDNPEAGSGWFTDSRDQHEYQWVRIGTQVWMADNLAWLPEVGPALTGSDTIPSYYVYAYGGTNTGEAKQLGYYKIYGVFYNWPAAMNGAASSTEVPSGTRGACPEGWHVPSDGEWDILVNFLGGEYTAGTSMKSKKGWSSFDGHPGRGDNSSGFNGLPAGGRNIGGGYYDLGFNALFWSTTDNNDFSVWYRNLGYFHYGVYRYFSNKSYGFSVRCVRDE